MNKKKIYEIFTIILQMIDIVISDFGFISVRLFIILATVTVISKTDIQLNSLYVFFLMIWPFYPLIKKKILFLHERYQIRLNKNE